MGTVKGESRAPAFVGRIKGNRRTIQLSFILHYDRMMAVNVYPYDIRVWNWSQG